MSQDKEAFLDRWSRLKREQAPEQATDKPVEKAEQEAKGKEAAAALPPVGELKPDSDFAPFMAAKVDDGTRRAALKKLFADAHFNVPDRFEAYCEDYTQGEPIPVEMLKTLNQARRLLFDEPEKTAKAAPEKPAAQPEPPPQDPKDAAGKQDA